MSNKDVLIDMVAEIEAVIAEEAGAIAAEEVADTNEEDTNHSSFSSSFLNQLKSYFLFQHFFLL